VGGRIRIITSLLFGLALIASVSFLRTPDVTAGTDIEDPRNFVAALPLREYQEPTDTDGDGLRDWLEELTGTNPNLNDAARIASSTASSAPFVLDTETKKFALSFFEEMMAQHGGNGLSPEETQAVLAKSMKEFGALNQDRLYLRSDISILDDSSKGAVEAYGNKAGEVIVRGGSNPEKIEPELVLLGRALNTDDASHLADISKIRAGYETMQKNLLALEVPLPLLEEHLLLINSLTAVLDNVTAFEQAFKDPLVAYLRLKRYEQDVQGLITAVEGIRRELERNDVVYDRYEAGDFFFSLRP